MQLRASGGGLEFLSQARQTLLIAIKSDGQATTEELARETFLSPGAVRQHLLGLEALGLVTFVRLRNGPGRPRHMFRLTASGERMFPQLYAEVANTLLAAIEAEDSSVVERIVGRLVQEQVQLAGQLVLAGSRPERLLELVQLIERFGYFPRLEVVDESPAELTLRHCPLLSVATRHPGICRVECESMQRVLPGATITRTAHRLEGDPNCKYQITWDATSPED
ncbi:MAG: winged helix-turn-helix transcriptional regulator [Dehalococcoidia bacterium]|uniref:helix-turn-helix transcriptional regulator n=1 Tax=Candidatus Amarobacter glycogenicus TaxID=3140699 RepID=UPI003135E572|nr:winged helix-turn-helix transcriptional regulator [Dehalococcoidia bacterium]